MELLFPETSSDIGTEFSPCRSWRYTLSRRWSDDPMICWLMFNPSIGNETQLDSTLRKCRGFSRRWGYGGMYIVNLYAICGTDPKTPSRTSDPVGPMNDYWTEEVFKRVDTIVYAWGCAQHMKDIGSRIFRVMDLAGYYGKRTVCLGYRGDGHPRHPLMLPYTTSLEGFIWPPL